MAGQWYCKIAGKTSQPLSSQQLKKLADQGKLAPDDLVRQGSDGAWVPASHVKGLRCGNGSPAAEPAPKSAPAKRSKVLPVAQAMDEPPPLASPVAPFPQAVAKGPPPAPAPKRADPQGVGSPLGIATVPETATQKALGRSLASPRKRQRNNMLVVGVLTVAAIAVAVVGIWLLNQEQRSEVANGQKPAVETAQNGPQKPAENGESEPGDASAPGDKPVHPAAAENIRWIDASKNAVRRGSVRVQVLSARIGVPPKDVAETSEESLLITVQLQTPPAPNETAATPGEIRFRRWSSATNPRHRATLSDNTGKTYRQRNSLAITDPVAESPPRPLQPAVAGASTVSLLQRDDVMEELSAEGSGDRSAEVVPRRPSGHRSVAESLPPGGTIEDVLVFERPGDDVEDLRLVLPAVVFGGEGTLYFRIPGTWIKTGDEPDGSKLPPNPFDEPGDAKQPEPPDKPDPRKPETPDAPKSPSKEEMDPGEKAFKELFDDELKGDSKAEGEDFETMLKPPNGPESGKPGGKQPKRGKR